MISTARLLIQLNRHQVSARRGVILSRASGTGTTTALTQLGRAHELATRKRHPHNRARLPVVYVTVPSAATPKMLAQELARFFGLSFPARATHTDIVDAVCATASHVHVDPVVVDELHNLNFGQVDALGPRPGGGRYHRPHLQATCHGRRERGSGRRRLRTA
ncbi:TniB family NTP-binding protein [Streptomyces sp. NPDC058382]|uniref:TniB family NTP-binding protein n=1 Tax=unclassified Streptomyces TaxID=2593676 RepID=UPI0036457ED9